QRYWKQEPEPEIINRLTPIISNIASIANKQGLAIAIENHCEMTISSFIKLIETLQIPNVGVTLDTANIIRVGADLINTCKALASKSQLVHMKDLILHEASLGDPGGWWPCAPLGAGDLDLDGVLKILKSYGYDGLICIEMGDMHPEYNSEDSAARDSVNYLRKYMTR
ncbi:MAG: TIM barrel protein, partial [Chloroflexota bacterium]|nr:TIM barrel protein [Chloroflexota bacterium]